MKPAAPEEALLYARTRFALPPPGLAVFGGILTVFGLLGCLTVLGASIKEWRLEDLSACVLPAMVLLGVFVVVYGYWRHAAFRFYETHFVVDGSIPHHIEYARVVAVHIDSIHHPHSFIFPLDELMVAYDDDNDDTQSIRFFVHGTRLQRMRLKQIHAYLSSRIDYSRLSASDVE